MKKRIIIVSICFAVVLLLLPFKYRYKDGGTVEYRAVLYSIIKWHAIDNNSPSGYKTNTEFYFFPANLRRIDYYINNMPARLELFYNEELYYGQTLDYSWCNEYKNCTVSDVLLVDDVDFDDAIKTKQEDIINYFSPAAIKKAVIYKGTLDNLYSQEVEFTDEYIKTPKEAGNYVYILDCQKENNTVNYLFKVIVE